MPVYTFCNNWENARNAGNLFDDYEVKSVGRHYICSMIKQDIAHFIEQEKLLTAHDKILVAISGGADSVALLHLLLSLGYTCEAAHCNFHLRGEESDRDESFVGRLCHTLQVPLHATGFETESYAQERKISVEMAARELRYQWFDTLVEAHGFTAIAVAHHQDDSTETLLLNLIRGTGIHGLLGIRPKNGNIIRPLLCVTREDLICYLTALKQEYMIDSTNLESVCTRNKIRLQLIPLMEEINPSVKKRLFQTSIYLNEVSTVYHHTIEEGKLRVQTEQGILIPALLSEPSPRTLLFEILHPLGFNSSQIQDIMRALSGVSGKQFISNRGFRIIKDRNTLLLIAPSTDDASIPPFELLFEEAKYSTDYVLIKEKHIAYFDVDKLKGKFNVRKWRHGDSFAPFGLRGRKKVSDFMTDMKFSIARKEKQWVLCCGKSIAWVIGERMDNRFRVSKSTRRVVCVKMVNKK